MLEVKLNHVSKVAPGRLLPYLQTLTMLMWTFDTIPLYDPKNIDNGA